MNEKFIPGIYNYCDRWCERCTFTSRCRNYERTSQLGSGQLDVKNTAFWDNISANFQETLNALQKAAAEHGICINTVITKEEEELFQKREAFLRTTTREHTLSGLCKNYQKIAKPFVEKSEIFTDTTRELVEHAHLGITSEADVVHTVAGIGDCLGIIQWYLFFIEAKLQRALRGKLDDGWQEENGFQKDCDGSAKIALIAIEMSMAAWLKLYKLMPSSEDTAFIALGLLEQMQQKATEEFPKAMAFRRPGFDD